MEICADFVLDDKNSMSDRIKALEKLDKVMGEESDNHIPTTMTEDDVKVFVEDTLILKGGIDE